MGLGHNEPTPTVEAITAWDSKISPLWSFETLIRQLTNKDNWKISCYGLPVKWRQCSFGLSLTADTATKQITCTVCLRRWHAADLVDTAKMAAADLLISHSTESHRLQSSRWLHLLPGEREGMAIYPTCDCRSFWLNNNCQNTITIGSSYVTTKYAHKKKVATK